MKNRKVHSLFQAVADVKIQSLLNVLKVKSSWKENKDSEKKTVYTVSRSTEIHFN